MFGYIPYMYHPEGSRLLAIMETLFLFVVFICKYGEYANIFMIRLWLPCNLHFKCFLVLNVHICRTSSWKKQGHLIKNKNERKELISHTLLFIQERGKDCGEHDSCMLSLLFIFKCGEYANVFVLRLWLPSDYRVIFTIK